MTSTLNLMDLTKKSALGTESDIRNLCIVSRFLKEMKLWRLWKEYIPKTELNGRWWKGAISPMIILARVDFTVFLKRRNKLPSNVFITDLFRVFLYYLGVKDSIIKQIIYKYEQVDWYSYNACNIPILETAVLHLKRNGYLDKWRILNVTSKCKIEKI